MCFLRVIRRDFNFVLKMETCVFHMLNVSLSRQFSEKFLRNFCQMMPISGPTGGFEVSRVFCILKFSLVGNFIYSGDFRGSRMGSVYQI